MQMVLKSTQLMKILEQMVLVGVVFKLIGRMKLTNLLVANQNLEQWNCPLKNLLDFAM